MPPLFALTGGARQSFGHSSSSQRAAFLCDVANTLFGDLLKLTVADVTDHVGAIRERFAVTQGKTGGRPVSIALTPGTREALAAFIAASRKFPADYLFTPAERPHTRHITTVMLRRIVKSWCAIANLDPRLYSGHSLRRTKPSHVYQHTRNVAGVSRMLGQHEILRTRLATSPSLITRLPIWHCASKCEALMCAHIDTHQHTSHARS